jgi:hypothetical protein
VTSPRLFKDALEQVRSADKTLTRWMRENGLDLFEEYGSRRLNLRELSAIVRSANLTNDQGGPLTEATISKTWARQRQRMLTPRNVLKPGELVAGVVKLPGHEVEPLLTPKPVVSPERPPVPVRPSTQPAPAHLSAAEQIARMEADQRSLRPPMPKSVNLGIRHSPYPKGENKL